jgi:hypothetical protein
MTHATQADAGDKTRKRLPLQCDSPAPVQDRSAPANCSAQTTVVARKPNVPGTCILQTATVSGSNCTSTCNNRTV